MRGCMDSPISRASEFYDASALRESYRMCAVVCTELDQNALQVAFDGFLGQAQVTGNDLVGFSSSDQCQNLGLPR